MFPHSLTKVCSLVFTACMVSTSSCRCQSKKKRRTNGSEREQTSQQNLRRPGRLTPCPSKMVDSVLENFSKHPCRTGNSRTFMTSRSSNFPARPRGFTHLHHGVPGAVVSQLPQPVDEALAGLAVGPAGLHHGLALFHQLEHTRRTPGLAREARRGGGAPFRRCLEATGTWRNVDSKKCVLREGKRGSVTWNYAPAGWLRSRRKRLRGCQCSPSPSESRVRSRRSGPLRYRL